MIFGKKNSLHRAYTEEVPKKRRSLLRKLSIMSGFSFESPMYSPPASSSRTQSPRQTLDNVFVRCELTLLSALQGVELTCSERQSCASEIDSMTLVEKRQLIDFFQNDAATCALENNACKAFVCSALNTEVLLQNPEVIQDLWNKLSHEIIPTLQSICYPLQTVDPCFDVQKTVLAAFRDRVLSKLLRDVHSPVAEVNAVLFTVMLESENVSPAFQRMVDVCLGNDKPVKMRVKPTRSKTLPNDARKKSVSWVDSRKSATISS